MWKLFIFALIGITSCINVVDPLINETSYGFEVDYENNQFLLDGKPFQYVSGSFHYFRTPRAYWRDRLRKMRACGLNAVSTYVEWSLHQPQPNVWKWTDEEDVVAFLKMAQEEDLYVLLRPGPYICAERDAGGLPPWLLTLVPDIELRTNDSRYLNYAENYLNTLMEQVKPLLRGNGGPVIMVQVENEYGSFHACDTAYKERLRDVISAHVGTKALLYTTDGSTEKALKCGKISGVYATIDFGASSDPNTTFPVMRKIEPKGPLVNSEYYSGWLTHWGEVFQRVPIYRVTKNLKTMLSMGASVNIYMFYGGTNFGFTAGANGGANEFLPDITSYDYDAPLTEAGDPTDKYFAIRDIIAQFLPMPNIPLPTVKPKGDYGSVFLAPIAKFLDKQVLKEMSVTVGTYDEPPTFELLSLGHGYVLYEADFPTGVNDPAVFKATVNDRGLVYVDNYLVGTLSRTLKIKSLIIQNPYAKRISVLVENQGHLNFGNLISDWKGIWNATIDKIKINNWNVTSFSMDNIKPLDKYTTINYENENLINGPVFLRAFVNIEGEPLDTYIDPTGWGKGVIYINGNNIGRYWPTVGPQVTLYVPSVWLKTGENEIIIFETEYIPTNRKMKFVTTPELG